MYLVGEWIGGILIRTCAHELDFGVELGPSAISLQIEGGKKTEGRITEGEIIIISC